MVSLVQLGPNFRIIENQCMGLLKNGRFLDPIHREPDSVGFG